MLNGCDLYIIYIIVAFLTNFIIITIGTITISSDSSSHFSSQTTARYKYLNKSVSGFFSEASRRSADFDIPVLYGNDEKIANTRTSNKANQIMGHQFRQSRRRQSTLKYDDILDHGQRRLKRDLRQGLSEADVRQLDRKVYARFHEMLTHCLPASQAAEDGYYRIHQRNTFQLICERGKTRPLYTFKNWSCDPSWLLERGHGIPTLCHPKMLPTLIVMEREIVINDLADSDCAHTTTNLQVLQKAWTKQIKNRSSTTFKIHKMIFQFEKDLSGGECSGYFDSNQTFQVQTRVRVKVTHQPKYFYLRKSVRPRVQAELDKITKKMLDGLRRDRKLSSYVLRGSALLFQSNECKVKTSSVQNDERFFYFKIPSCRFCDRGMYLDKTFHTCHRCPRGWYANLEDSICYHCPHAISSMIVSGDSLVDCFSVYVGPTGVFLALKEGLFVLAGFHLCIFNFIFWNFRDAVWSSPKDDDTEDKASTNAKSF